MKKSIFLAFILCAVACIPVFGQETYTLLCGGTVQGTVTIQRDRGGKITITGSLTGGISPSVEISHAICPLIPPAKDRWTGNLFFTGRTRSIIIDGNTTTQTKLDGSWSKSVVTGNTSIGTSSSGTWTKDVVTGNTSIGTNWDGSWSKSVVTGNTRTTTFSSGGEMQIVVNGNTETFFANGVIVSITVVSGNTTTTTFPNIFNSWTKTVVDKQGYNIFITTTTG